MGSSKDNLIDKINELVDQNENLAYENKCFGEFLDKLGYSLDDISYIASGSYDSLKVEYDAIRLDGVSTGAIVPTIIKRFRALNDYDARHWVINHLDCSFEWEIKKVKEIENEK